MKTVARKSLILMASAESYSHYKMHYKMHRDIVNSHIIGTKLLIFLKGINSYYLGSFLFSRENFSISIK
jgi:hypothetical protein